MTPLMFCHLREIMKARNLQVTDLCKAAGVHRSLVNNLRQNTFERLPRAGIAKICKALDLPLGELFSFHEEHPWFAVRLHHNLTVHLGCNTFNSPERTTEDGVFGRHYYGSWDIRSYVELREFLDGFADKITVRYRGHDFTAETDQRAIDAVFGQGDHLLIGSPISNRFMEFVICRMYDVPPFTAQMRTKFPLNFVWDSSRSVPSSFGYKGQGGEFGIFSHQAGRLVARRTFVAQGEGEDCGLIVVQRLFQPVKNRRHFGRDDHRVIICILGHSGPGTLAALRVATDPTYGPYLWPQEFGTPVMAVVSARYTRAPGAEGRDNRVLTRCELVDPANGESLSARIDAAVHDAQRSRRVPPARRKSGESARTAKNTPNRRNAIDTNRETRKGETRSIEDGQAGNAEGKRRRGSSRTVVNERTKL
jgi:DNA-binding Xre family transcriptional regulator